MLGTRRVVSEKARLGQALVVEENWVVPPTVLDPRETCSTGTALL